MKILLALYKTVMDLFLNFLLALIVGTFLFLTGFIIHRLFLPKENYVIISLCVGIILIILFRFHKYYKEQKV